MARNRLGQFTSRRRERSRGLFAGREPIAGTEENGVTSGETVILGAQPEPPLPEGETTRKR